MATTTGAGYFRFVTLPAAVYSLTVTSPGFRTFVQQGIHAQVAEVRTVNIALELGVESNQITITSPPPIIETGEARISELIVEGKLHNLPLVGRNFYGLVVLAAGTSGLPSSSGDIFNTNYGVDLNAVGHRSESNNFLVDSGSVTSTPRGRPGQRQSER